MDVPSTAAPRTRGEKDDRGRGRERLAVDPRRSGREQDDAADQAGGDEGEDTGSPPAPGLSRADHGKRAARRRSARRRGSRRSGRGGSRPPARAPTAWRGVERLEQMPLAAPSSSAGRGRRQQSAWKDQPGARGEPRGEHERRGRGRRERGRGARARGPRGPRPGIGGSHTPPPPLRIPMRAPHTRAGCDQPARLRGGGFTPCAMGPRRSRSAPRRASSFTPPHR